MKHFNLKMMLCLTALSAAMLAGCNEQSVTETDSSGTDIALLPADSTAVTTLTDAATTTSGATALTTLFAAKTTATSSTAASTSTATTTSKLTEIDTQTTTSNTTVATVTLAPPVTSGTKASTAATTVSTTTKATTVATTVSTAATTTIPASELVNLFSELTLGGECSDYISAHTDYDFHEAASCMGEGMDRVYVYKGYTLLTYFDGKQELLTEVDILKPGFVTPKGAQVGWTRTQVESVYGKEAFDVYERNGSMTQFKYDGDIVSSIELYINWV